MRKLILAVVVVMIVPAVLRAGTPSDDALAKGQATIDKLAGWLITQQKPDGSLKSTDRDPPAVSAMAMSVIAQDAAYGPASDPVKKALAALLLIQKPDGGFYRDALANYNTAIIVSALTQLHEPELKKPIETAVSYLKGSQISADTVNVRGEKLSADDPTIGGWNYGGARSGMADISNTATVLEALHDAGVPSTDPAFQNALKFVSRLQNNSETNPAKWAGNDGGFIYNPGRRGEGMSSAGETVAADGQKMPKSYGSMTYSGLKSLLYAGVTKDDPRVKAALSWVSNNWTLDENPGMAGSREGGQSGVFYYYHTFAAALDVSDSPSVKATNGEAHDWRIELINKLAAIQKPDGSFVGAQQWMENNPMIASSLAGMALQRAMTDLKQHPAK